MIFRAIVLKQTGNNEFNGIILIYFSEVGKYFIMVRKNLRILLNVNVYLCKTASQIRIISLFFTNRNFLSLDI